MFELYGYGVYISNHEPPHNIDYRMMALHGGST